MLVKLSLLPLRISFGGSLSHSRANGTENGMRFWSMVLALALMPVTASAQHRHPAMGAKLLTGLGGHHYTITTKNPQAQRFFDQGLALAYAFNHPEAKRSFEEAVRLDSSCAMCHWGVAFVLGPMLENNLRKALILS